MDAKLDLWAWLPSCGLVTSHGPDVDDPLLMIAADGARHAFHADFRGSAAALSDASGRLAQIA